MGKILRRTFLIGSTAIVGGVAFGYWYVTKPFPNPLKKNLGPNEAALTPYVLINQDGVTIIVPRAEMGQGVRTTLAALVAEELDIGLDNVNVIHGPAAKAYYNTVALEEGANKPVTDESRSAEFMRNATHVVAKLMPNQTTGGSTSVHDAFEKMREAGAAARIALVKAAAKKLGVAERDLTTENGAVVAPDGRRTDYTELAVLARDIKPPKKPALKPQSEWKILGKSQPRLDMVGKCTGTAEFAIDVRLPDMLYATVRANPHHGAGISSFDASRAEAMSGVEKVMQIDNSIAVVARNTWLAFQAADALDVQWEKAAYPETTAGIIDSVAAAFDNEPDTDLRDDGDVEAALNDGDIVEAEYLVPYLAHSTMEPMNATALLKDGRLDIWVGSQSPLRCQTVGKELTGLSEDNIHIHTTYLGGGFGRRGETDFVRQAVQIAMAMEGTPIKMTWPREEDMRHDFYRSLNLARFKGVIKDGNAISYDMRTAGSATAVDAFARQGTNLNIPDPTIVQNAWDNPYTIENYRVFGYKAPTALPVGWWRSVGASQNGFFQESAIDEMAHAAGADPLEFRLGLLDHEPSRKVLETVREMSNWNSPLPDGHAHGVAYFLSFGVPVAEVIEVAQTDRGIKLVNAYAAADVGIALDPANVEAQIQSGMIYGLTAAIMGEITVEDGKVKQSNFHDYDAMRIYQTPPITVKVLENGTKIRGIGEPGTPPAAPALANAVFALTGQRIRALPLKNSVSFI